MEMTKLIIIFTISSSSLFFPAHPFSYDDDLCSKEVSCSPNGAAVRFPFRLIGKQQPEHCGYNSNFNLRCDQLNRTILELPSHSTKLVVTNISYKSQSMVIQPFESCFAQQLRLFDVSSSPFELSTFGGLNYYNSYSLFSCPSSRDGGGSYDWESINCLRSSGYEVYAIPKYTGIEEMADLLESCTKMYDTGSVPRYLFHSETFNLSWSLPVCQRCEVRGGVCRWQSRSSHQIGCFGGHYSGIWKILRIPVSIIGCLLLMPAFAATNLVLHKMEELKKSEKIISTFLADYAAMKPTRYSFAEIKKITNDFKDKLGEGGYGDVFKGQISNKICVAVKVLHNSTGVGEEFINEMGTMGRMHHVNVVRLLGFCAEGYKRALVFEFLPNGSLDRFIFSDGQEHHVLGMQKLQEIAIGISRGIEYLHQGCEQRILHFDIKPHNILLDENYNPKISDFGLAKLCEKGRSAVSMTAARGTMGYIAPEVFSRQFGNVTYKSDIYSFGMLLLEMVGRRKNTDATVENASQVYFPEWIYGNLVREAEFRIEVEESGMDDQIAKKLAMVGLRCIQWSPVERPSITMVLQMLEGSVENLSLPPNPFTSGGQQNLAESREDNKRLDTELFVIPESE